LVEMAARGGGFGVFSKLVPAASGVNISELLIRQVMGENLDLSGITSEKNIFTLKFFPISKTGTVTKIDGLEVASQIPNVEVGSFVKVGQKVSHEYTDGSRLGYMLVKAPNAVMMRRLAGEVESLVHFEIV